MHYYNIIGSVILIWLYTVIVLLASKLNSGENAQCKLGSSNPPSVTNQDNSVGMLPANSPALMQSPALHTNLTLAP